MSRTGATAGSWREGSGDQDLSELRSEGREPGTRRRKLAGYLKAANEMRQSYQQSYTAGWKRETQFEDVDDGTPGNFPEAAVVRTGEEEMILFPSYATKHVKSKPDPNQRQAQESGSDEDQYSGPGDEEFWRQEWQKYEDDHAVVDVDVRGWIYTPFSGVMSRKQRIFIGLARQMVGIPAPPTQSENQTPAGSRNSSPPGYRERIQARLTRQDEEYVTQQAESIMKKGEAEADAAGKGEYSENPRRAPDNESIISTKSRGPSPHLRHPSHSSSVRHESSRNSLRSLDGKDLTPIQKRASWNQPANMNQAELREAHTHLMTRLKPFMAQAMGNTAISVFFYNNEISRQRTVTTNAAGHFTVRAALDFIPTHVRVLASEKLSVTEEVIITSPAGISLISDIDDTIKHSAISSGAREIFRNAFIRELGDLTIDGVREWYAQLADLGVKFHYVSNSPWQLFPVVQNFFSMSGLPPGSFHLKQYSGMLQGIFEPVAERKKGTLDKLARDFPERKFMLVGDSGEADLEVYTDFVLENPGRVLAIFIRDVTTPVGEGFFDSSMGPLAGNTSNSGQQGSGASQVNAMSSPEDDDPDMKAAIAASLRDMEMEGLEKGGAGAAFFEHDSPERRPTLPPRRPTEPAARAAKPSENLIDFSDDEKPTQRPNQLSSNRTRSEFPASSHAAGGLNASPSGARRAPPIPPKKPVTSRSSVTRPDENTDKSRMSQTVSKAPSPPPKPRSSSTTGSITITRSNDPMAQNSQGWKPGVPQKPASLNEQQSYASAARQKLVSAYNHLPSASSYLYGTQAPLSQSGADGGRTWNSSTQSYSTSHNQSNPNDRTAGMDPSAPYQQVNKREQMWRQRWSRAQEILGGRGVLLRSWRVGTDALQESIKLVKQATNEMEVTQQKSR